MHRGPDGKLWMVASADDHGILERRNADGTIESLPAAGAHVSDLYGIEVGAPWAVLDDDNVAHWDEANKKWITWRIPRPPKDPATTMSLPRATDIRVHAPDDVWISVSYDDINPKEPGAGDIGNTSYGALLHVVDPSNLK